jgi:hypothetical protein
MLRWLPLLWLGAAAAALLSPLREPWMALAGVPGLLLAPGWAIAARLNRREDGTASLLDVSLDAAWLSAPAAAAGWALARETGLGGAGVLAVATLGTVLGEGWARPARASALTLAPNERLALGAGAGLLAAWFALEAGTVARPLDRYWWFDGVEERLPAEGRAPGAGEGWAEVTPIGDADTGLVRLRPDGPGPAGLAATGGPVLVAVHGPVGAAVEGLGARPLRVEASPVEAPAEGPVWRYREAGVAARLVEGGTALSLRFSDPAGSTLYVLASQDAVWTLDGLGELRFVHYYQLLNMVEQLRWADERWVTDVQPPLGTWVLAPVLAFTRGGQPTANVLLLYVLALSVVAMTRVVSRFAPAAPAPAWLLPGAAAAVTGKLLLEPGSAGMPDGLYACAIVAGLGGRGEAYTLVAQLLRYPGAAVGVLGLALAGEWRRAARAGAIVALVAVAFAAGGALTGALDGWITTVAWESGPEHWHGEYDPAVLLARVPAFYATWLLYAGGTPLLALLRWGRGVRVTLGTAAVYSLLLATIDHSPTHYFLPLVQLASCACACAAAPAAGGSAWRSSRLLGTTLSALGVAGLLIFWLTGHILG